MNRTERHRLAQARLGAETTALLIVLWDRVEPRSDADFGRWLALVAAVVRQSAATSAALAASYYSTLRGDGYAPIVEDVIDEARLTASLTATGPAAMRRAIGRGVEPATASVTAKATSAAAGMRHALNAGRTTLLTNVANDDDAYAWRRVVSGNACKFCDALAGRVHRDASAGFAAHDGCACSAEPLFR